MLRNKEIKQFGICFLIVALVMSLIGWHIDRAAGIMSIISTVVLGILFGCFTKARYQKIAQISEQIDRVLHHEDQVYISEQNEGELAILESEIEKMTLRIREQNQALRREKEHLADSMADIAHQLRTPLTSTNLILSLLENTSDEVKRKEMLREAETLFEQMDWLITSLLKLSRLDAGIVSFKKESVAISQLVRHALQPFLISMELHEVALEVEIPEGVTIQGDISWLSEALQNLIKNSLESVGHGGKLTITCIDNPLHTELCLHDSGKGFEKEDLPYLFDRFYRGKNTSTSGYGIGLALSRMIITRQGGTIKAKNHPQGGALFCIRFPK